MLKIGFDAKRLFHNLTGLGNYSRTLVHDLQRFYPKHEYHLFTPSLNTSARTEAFLNPAAFQTHTAKGNAAYWRTFNVKKDLIANAIQLYHGLSHEIPKGIRKTGIKSVVTIHDLAFRHYPNLYPVIDRKIYDWKFRHSCENANRVIAISENTKRDIMRFYKIAEEKIEVIYQTCPSPFKREVPEEGIPKVLKKYRIPKDFILSVGSIIERKNLMQIVKALHLIPSGQRPALVALGNGKSYKHKILRYIDKYNLQPYFFLPEQVDFSDFAAIYHQASALIYPSSYEGFGIPIIEALFCKTPVITTRISSLPEAAGPGAHYIDQPEPEAIKDGIEKILGNRDYATRLAENGYRYVQRFRSKVIAQKVMTLYKEVLNRNP